MIVAPLSCLTLDPEPGQILVEDVRREEGALAFFGEKFIAPLAA